VAHETLLAELDKRRSHARRMGGEQKLAKRKERGQLNAEERLQALVDPGSFIETGLLGASGVFKDDEARTPRDGKIVGFAQIDGRDVALVVNDFSVDIGKGATDASWSLSDFFSSQCSRRSHRGGTIHLAETRSYLS